MAKDSLIRPPRLLILDATNNCLDRLVGDAITFHLKKWGIPTLHTIILSNDHSSVHPKNRIVHFEQLVEAAKCGDYSNILKTFSLNLTGIDFSIFYVEKDLLSIDDMYSDLVAFIETFKIAIMILTDGDVDKLDSLIKFLPSRNLIGLVFCGLENGLMLTNIKHFIKSKNLQCLGVINASTKPEFLENTYINDGNLCIDEIIRGSMKMGPLEGVELPHNLKNHRTFPKLVVRRTSVGGKVLMVQGATSDAGKTFLVTALARYFSNRGLSVAPFKGQNMSNNARIVDGGEIGVAQYFQALAARSNPDIRMNPVLIKPQNLDSQVIVNGKPDYVMSQMPWRLRKPLYWPAVLDSLTQLRQEYDLVIVEGAGSPMETYLRDNDIANMKIAMAAEANVLLVADAARGGVFPHLYGTWSLMSEVEKRLIRGFVLNLFFESGDAALLTPGISHLQSITNHTPVLGIVPTIEHKLPSEDLYSLRNQTKSSGTVVAIISYPKMSNFDEFKVLEALQDVSVKWVKSPRELEDAEIVVLPGSKHVASDLKWIRMNGFDNAIRKYHATGKRLLGVCGGLQMLGHSINDPLGIEGSAIGLKILSVKTEFKQAKIQRNTSTKFSHIDGVWSSLSGVCINGYEIRQGRSELLDEQIEAKMVIEGGLAFSQGNILALYVHGLFENSAVLKACFNQDKNIQHVLEDTFENLANLVDNYLDGELLESIAMN